MSPGFLKKKRIFIYLFSKARALVPFLHLPHALFIFISNFSLNWYLILQGRNTHCVLERASEVCYKNINHLIP